MSESPDLLVVENLSKRFVLHNLQHKLILACHGVSFRVKPGEFLGIVGPSGAGKSTILKCIYRTCLPSSGNILYRSVNDGTLDLAQAGERTILELRRREIGYVSQFLRVMPRVSAMDLLANELVKLGWAAESARGEACKYLDLMRLDRTLWDAYPSFFSGGEQQRINLARALIVRPRLLLLDEPTAALDIETKQTVIRVLKNLKNTGTTLIGIFHDTDSLQRLADQVYAVQSGRCDLIQHIKEVI